MKKRFIAGAVCPKCKQMDRIVVFTRDLDRENSTEVRKCVNCDFEEEKNFLSGAGELPTRVNDGSSPREGEDLNTSVVKILDQ